MKKRVILLILLMMALSVGGCGMVDDMGGDLKDSELAAALAVDKVEGEGEGEYLAEVALLYRDRALERQYADSYYCVTADGKSVACAVEDLSNRGARQINFAHAGVLLLGGEAAKSTDWLDFAMTEGGIRPTVYPVLTAGLASDFLHGGGDLSSVYLLENSLEPRGGRATAWAVTLQELYMVFKQAGIAAVLPYIASENAEDNADNADGQGIAQTNVAAYDGTAWQVLSDRESLAWRILLRGKHIRGEVLELRGGASVKLLSAQVKSKVQGTDICYEVFIKGEMAGNSDDLALSEVERRLAEKVQAVLAEAVLEQMERGVDFLGLGREIWRYEPALWQEISEGDYLTEITAKFTVEAEIEGGEK